MNIQKDRVNIYKIASEAGVSPATVSRVMSNNARVSKEKRERVEEVIKKYDFKPSMLARSLSTAKTNTIGLIIADISSPFYATVAAECERIADERGYMLLILSSLSNSEKEKRQLMKLYEQQVGAILIVGGHIDHRTSDIEYVELINRVNSIIPIVATGKLPGAQNLQVQLDEYGSMRLAMEYLFSLGHERIALVGGRYDAQSTYDKCQCYRKMLEAHGIPFREDYELASEDYSNSDGYCCMKKLLKVDERPTAVIGINDYTASGIIRAMHQANLRVPEDISLIAFDNTFLANAMTPPLTAVSADYAEFASALLDTAIGAAEGVPQLPVQTIKVSLKERSSCRRLTDKVKGEAF